MKYESNLPSNRTCKKCGDEWVMWPWSEIANLKQQAQWSEDRVAYWQRISEMRENMALKAYRDLMAANKGIRRLKARLNKYEAHRKEGV